MANLDLDQEASAVLFSADIKRWVVGFSGGMDSTVLLHLLVNQADRPEMLALYIDHGLQAESETWTLHCADICQQFQIPFASIAVTVAASGSGETNARESRYQAFQNVLKRHDLLVLGHHLDDQLETAFLNLLRGSEVPGLTGIPRARRLGDAMVCRPLLGTARTTIKSYALEQNLSWIEDPSNALDLADRNFLRNRVMPLLVSRFPDIRSKVLTGLHRDVQARQLLHQLARQDLQSLQDDRSGISLQALKMLGEARAMNLLRTQLSDKGVALPSGKHLRQGLADMQGAEPDKSPLINLKGYQYRRFKGRIYLLKTVTIVDWQPIEWPKDAQALDIEGIRITRDKVDSGGLPMHLGTPQLRLKQPGEVILRDQRRKINDILREASVPSWIRSRLPVLVSKDQLIAIPAIPDWSFDQQIATPYLADKTSQGWRFNVFFEA